MPRLSYVPNILQPKDRETFTREHACTVEALLRILAVDVRLAPSLRVWVGPPGGAAVPVPRESWETHSVRRDHEVLAVRVPQVFAAGVLGKALFTLAFAVGVVKIASNLFKAPDLPPSRDDESSGNYGFRGQSNGRVPGLPIEVPYGKFRQAGTIIGEYIRTTVDPPSSTLHLLISFGWGPIEGFGNVKAPTVEGQTLKGLSIPTGIEINDNPVENLTGVEVQVRLGDNDQDPIAGFEQTITPVEVGPFELTSPEVSNEDTTQIAAGYDINNPYDGTNETYFANFARTFDIDVESDSLIVRLEAPVGYFGADKTSGNLVDAWFSWQIRYRELDGANLPITTGGQNGDGWLRLDPAHGPITGMIFKRRGFFGFEISVPLYDPQTYQSGAVGQALDVKGTAADRAVFPVDPANKPKNGGEELGELSVSMWFRLDTIPGSPSVGDIVWIAGDYEDATKRGWGLFLQYTQYPLGNPDSVWVLKAIVAGNGSPGFVIIEPPGAVGGQFPPVAGAWVDPTGAFRHIGFSYKRNSSLRLFLNGTQIANIGSGTISATDLEWSDAGITVGRNPNWAPANAVTMDGRVDQMVAFNAFLGDVNMAFQFNNGQGTGELLDSARSAYTFNDTAGSQQYASGWWLDMTIPGGGTTDSGVAAGVVRDSVTARVKRMKARVEVVRINQTSTNDYVSNQVDWVEVQRVLDAGLVYPRRALLALTIPDTEGLRSVTKATAVVLGRTLPEWDGQSLSQPSYLQRHSSNPAWVTLDAIREPLFGMDDYQPELVSFAALAARSDEIVFDGSRVYTLDGSGFEDAFFSNSFADFETGQQRGLLTVIWTVPNGAIPDDWVPGHHFRLVNFPLAADHAQIFNDVGLTDGKAVGGYEIVAVDATDPDRVRVAMYWDRLGEPDPWTSGTNISLSLTNGVADLAGAQLEGGERRFEFNGVFDRTRRGWDVLRDILAVARATPIRDGKSIRVRMSQPGTAVGLITEAAIIPGSWNSRITSVQSAVNSLDLLIQDRARGYAQDTVRVTSSALKQPGISNKVRPKSFTLFGTTSRGQARRHGNYTINAEALRNRSGSFLVDPSALPYEPGDIVRVAGAQLDRGVGGRIMQDAVGDPAEALLDTDDFTAAGWSTAGGATVVASGVDPLGGTAYEVEDTGAALGILFQASPLDLETGLADGKYVFGLWVEPGTSQYCRMDVLSSNGDRHFVAFDLGARTISVEGGGQDGGGGIQNLGATGWFLIWAWVRHAPDSPTDSVSVGFSPAVGLEGADAAETGTVRIARASLSSGEYPSGGSLSSSSFVIDREVEVPAPSMRVYHQSRTDRYQVSVLQATLTPPGTYPPGSTLYVSPDLSEAPRRHDQYALVRAGIELIVELGNSSMSEDLQQSFEWTVHSDEVHDDRAGDDGSEQALSNDDGGGLGSLSSGSQRLLGNPSITYVGDQLVASAPGVFQSHVRMAWEFEDEDRVRVSSVRVWMRVAPLEGDGFGGSRWELVETLDGPATFVDAPARGAGVGRTVELAVQPVGVRGQARRPGQCALIVHRLVGYGVTKPDPPTGIVVTLTGRWAEHTWDPLADQTVTVECRRGGWLLGYRVFESAPGESSYGPSRDWAGGPVDQHKLVYRARDAAGQYSDPVEVLLDPRAAEDLEERGPSLVTNPAQAWETYGSAGWVNTVPAAGDPNIGVHFQDDGAGNIQYDPASLQTTTWRSVYVTRETATVPTSGSVYRESRELYVEAYWEAVQVHPVTPGTGMDWSRWSTEGPVSLIPGEENAEIICEFRINEDGRDTGWSDWRRYVPGTYRLVDVQFRLRARRPTLEHDILVSKFQTRITGPRLSMEQRTPLRSRLEGESL